MSDKQGSNNWWKKLLKKSDPQRKSKAKQPVSSNEKEKLEIGFPGNYKSDSGKSSAADPRCFYVWSYNRALKKWQLHKGRTTFDQACLIVNFLKHRCNTDAEITTIKLAPTIYPKSSGAN